MKLNNEEKLRLMLLASEKGSEGYESQGNIDRIIYFYQEMLAEIEKPESDQDDKK